MNLINSCFNRESGFSNKQNYNFALRRLCVAKEDSWRGIEPIAYGADYNPEPPILSAKFANCDGYRHLLAIANEDGKIALQDATKRNTEPEERPLSAQQCHHNAVFDLEWAPGQMRIVSASGDHTANLWDIANGSELCNVRAFVGHSRSVKTAAFRRNDPSVFATGGRDGAIIIWDTRANLNVDMTPRADNCILSGHVGGPATPVSQRKRTRTPRSSSTTSSSSITGLAFQDTYTLISCGAGDGIIKVWDLRRNYMTYKKEPHPKHSLPYAGTSTLKGFTNLVVDQAGTRLYANCMDNTIYCYNLYSYSPKPWACYKGHLNSTFYIKACLSPDNQYLLSGSSDEKAYIWNLNHAEQPLVSLNAHTVEVTCVAWGATHDRPIVTCSDDARHKIWRIGPEKITDTDRTELYRGQASYVRKFNKPKSVGLVKHQYNLRDLESTPRSLKRLVEQNERTPGTSTDKGASKRSFMEMVCVNNSQDCGTDIEGHEPKRPKTMESRGRRLFSPSTSNNVASCSSSSVSPTVRCLNIQLHTIHEDDRMPSPSESAGNALCSPVSRNQTMSLCNQENNVLNNRQQTSNTSYKSAQGHYTPPSPLCERFLTAKENCNQVVPVSVLSSPVPAEITPHNHHHIMQSLPSSTTVFSPTSNLPNYVIDGEAPHLSVMSPKRKAKDKVDWLTKIRKQKLMSVCRGTTLAEKIQEEQEHLQKSEQPHHFTITNVINSPSTTSHAEDRLHHNITPKSLTPKRRVSLHHRQEYPHSGQHPKTPTSSRRNSETSILRFFSRQQQQQQHQQQQQQQQQEQTRRSINVCVAAHHSIESNEVENGVWPLPPIVSDDNYVYNMTSSTTTVLPLIESDNRMNRASSFIASATTMLNLNTALPTEFNS